MAKIAVSVRMEEEIHGEFKRWADEDKRSLGNYLEALFMQERERRLHGDITLAVLNEKLDRVLRQKKCSSRKKEQVAEEDEFALPDYVDEEIWDDFVRHRKEIKKPLTSSTLKYELRCMETARANGWDVNFLIEDAIQKGWRGWFFKKHNEANPDREEEDDDVMTEEEIAAEKEARNKELIRKRKEDDEYKKNELLKNIQNLKDRMRAPKITPSKGWFTLEVWDRFVDRVYEQVGVFSDLQYILNNVAKRILALDNGVEWNDSVLLKEMAKDKIWIVDNQLCALMGDY